MAKFDGKKTWKIIRMHAPIFNSEADTDIKKNKAFMDLFKNAGIHAHFVSHNHSAQFDISVFEDTILDSKINKKAEYMKEVVRCGSGPRDKSKSKEENLTGPLKNENEVSNESITDDTDPYYGTDNGRFEPKVNIKTCSRIDRTKAFLKNHMNENIIYIRPENKELLLQILVGNSGRILDGIFSDRFSDLTQLFATTGVNQFGYATASFTKNDLLIKYFITGETNEIFKIKIVKTEVNKSNEVVEKNFTTEFVNSISEKYKPKPIEQLAQSVESKGEALTLDETENQSKDGSIKPKKEKKSIKVYRRAMKKAHKVFKK